MLLFLYACETWTTPLLEVFVACAIWRAPARTRRLVVIVAGALPWKLLSALWLCRVTPKSTLPLSLFDSRI